MVGRDGGVGALEDLLLDLRRLVEEVLALGDLEDDVGLALQRLDEARVVAAALVDRLDRRRGAEVVRVDLEDAEVRLHRRLVVAELGLVVLGEPAEEPDLELVVLDGADDLVEEPGQLLPLPLVAGDARDALEPVAGLVPAGSSRSARA